jgi:membrane protein CcdC involved in cytochrome C biogenesis
MWVVPLLIMLGIGTGLYFTPHEPFGLVAWLSFAAALALGAAVGWWRGKMVAIHIQPDGALKAQASPLGLILIVLLLLGRTVLRGLMETNAENWHLDAAVITDAFMLFAVGLVVAQRLEMFIRARKMLSGWTQAPMAAGPA